MKKLVLAAVSAAFVGGLTIAAPANAQYLGGASANDYNRYQEAADPGYDLYHTRERYYGYNIYSNGYGYGYVPHRTAPQGYGGDDGHGNGYG